ncbi:MULTISPECIES: hypothetical protein [unclassified Sphingobium]|uniref:hypothetical protein n=1 Tax=unclassified Sphingobium TaxID=2611147 RepID=UPI0035A62A3E
MSTEHLHREMADAFVTIGEDVEPRIDALMHEAFDRAMALTELGDQRHHDALSLAFQLCAVMVAKATILLGDCYPEADPTRIWTTAMTDLQLRTMQAIAQLQATRVAAKATVQ